MNLYINISNQLYYLVELKKLIKADSETQISFTNEDIENCPLLRDLINQGKIIPVVNNSVSNFNPNDIRFLGATDPNFDDEQARRELSDSQFENTANNNTKSPTDEHLNVYDVGRTQVPVFHTQESPLVETQPPRDILIDEYQKSHQKSLYDEPNDQKKK